MSWAVRRPHPVVRPYIRRYIGYEQSDVGLAVHRGLPSRHVTVVISLRDPITVSARSETVRAQALVGGLHTEPVLVSQDRTQCGLHLELNSLGVRTVLGVSAARNCAIWWSGSTI